MNTFKYAVFAFELEGLAEDLRIVDTVQASFQKLAKAVGAFVQVVKSMEQAGPAIDAFKEKNCGSAYNLAVINLNQFPSAPELEFLLGEKVLGDPRSIFLVSLRGIQAPIYSVARVKVEREAQRIAEGSLYGAPSCVDTYTPANRAETAARVAEVLNAYLEEDELREKARLSGTVLPSALSPATELMRRSSTVFFGRRPGQTSTFMRPASRAAANQATKPDGTGTSGTARP
jgi:hypothetical protein